MNYRKFYNQALNVNVSSSFDIHHIDFDRKNNAITNLVALPRQLHQDYHTALKGIDLDHVPVKLTGNCSMHISDLYNYLELYMECNRWVDYRNHYLIGLPNIHNLNYNLIYD